MNKFTNCILNIISGAVFLLFFNCVSTASPLSSVQSFVISGPASTTGIGPLIQNSPVQLFVVGYPGETTDPALSRNHIDPDHKKIIIGGIDIAEASANAEPELFPNGLPLSWIGGKHPAFNWYSVKYWTPEWKQVVFNQIDDLINQGYDGAFLDVLYGDNEWQAGNIYGNTPYSAATKAMEQLLADIITHIKSKNPPVFYLLGANPVGIALDNPSALNGLDAIYFDGLFFVGNGATSIASTAGLQTFAQVAPIYSTLGIPIFSSDYPSSGDTAGDFQAFDYANSRGWLPSILPNGTPSNSFLSSGPFLFTAQKSNPSVVGGQLTKNFISGGNAPTTTLKGGNQGDYFIGGPGTNNIIGGSGDDIIYAHPDNAKMKGMLDIKFFAHNSTPVTPEVSVLINGVVALPPTPIVAPEEKGVPQEYLFDITPFGELKTVVIQGINISYTNGNNFSHVRIPYIGFNGAPISFASAKFSGQASALNNNTYGELDSGGTITFSPPTFDAPSPYLNNTADQIDGGGGTNTVIYRSNYSNYAISQNSDGSWLVTGRQTAEGPDTLKNIQQLQFADITVPLSTALPITTSCIFSYAQANFPALFSGLPSFGSYQQYTYAYFPTTGNIIGIDQTGGIWILGPASENKLLFVGLESKFSSSIAKWAGTVSSTGC